MAYNMAFSSRHDLVYAGSSVGTSSISLPVIREQYWCFSRRTRLENALILALIAFGVFMMCLIAAISVVGVQLDTYEVQVHELRDQIEAFEGGCYPQCLTPDQIESASSLVRSMNTSTEPCDDFYKFTCGGWQRDNPVPPSRATWEYVHADADTSLHAALEQILLKKNTTQEKNNPLEMARQFYIECIDSEGGSSDTEGLTKLRLLTMQLQKYTHWPTLNSEMARRLALQRLLPIHVLPDERNASLNIIHITMPELPMIPDKGRITDPEFKLKYLNYLSATVKEVQTIGLYDFPKFPEEETFSEQVLNLEQLVLQLAHEDDVSHYNRMNITQLQEITPASLDHELHWQTHISESLGIAGITGTTELVLHAPHYIERFDSITDPYEHMFVDYMFLQLYLDLGPLVYSGLRKIRDNFLADTTGARLSHPWTYQCVDTTNEFFGYALSQEYISQSFNTSHIELMNLIVGGVRKAAKLRLDSLEWLDASSKHASQAKLQDMSFPPVYQDWLLQPELVQQYYSKLSLPGEHFSNLETVRTWLRTLEADKLSQTNDRSQSPFSPTHLKAYNIKFYNSVVVPASMIRRPLLGLGNTALNYGAMGAFVAYTMARAFDTSGRMYDSLGHLQDESIWSETTTTKFEERTQCLIKQYDSYQVTPDMKVSGEMTLDSNVADAAGLKFAWLAFLAAMQQQTTEAGRGAMVPQPPPQQPPPTPTPERDLPGLERFSAEQLFFIAYAHTFCSTYTDESLEDLVLYGDRSPSRFRVLGSLANSEEFAAVFSCNATSGRTRTAKVPLCPLW